MRQKLGQHFLRDRNILNFIADAASFKKGDIVFEIGPGHGSLTRALLERGARLIAFEKDPLLAREVADTFLAPLIKDVSHFSIPSAGSAVVVLGDALVLLSPYCTLLKKKKFFVVGNIPYYISGALFRSLGWLSFLPERAVFLIQKEVALRMSAQKGLNALAAWVGCWADVSIERTVRPGSFSPPPAVMSAVVSLTKKKTSFCTPVFDRFIGIAFKHPKKTLVSNLREGGFSKEGSLALVARLGANSDVRAHTLSLAQLHTGSLLLERFS